MSADPTEQFEHVERARSTAGADAVWALWCEPATWPTWDPAVEAVTLDGPFAAGTRGQMRLGGGFDVPVELVIVEPGRRWLDRLTVGELVIEIDHVVEASATGCTLTVTTTSRGPGAHDVGAIVVNDAPQALDSLRTLAEN